MNRVSRGYIGGSWHELLTDAYDPFIVGVVMAILKEEWQPSPVAVGLVTSTGLLASAVGAVVFGRIAAFLGASRSTSMRY